MKIRSVDAYQIYDSRGNPTLEAEVTLADGTRGRGLVPSGVSTGQYEAIELRDGDKNRFRGRSVFRAIENVRTIIAPAVIGHDVLDQADIDRAMIELDGTPNKSRLGANALLGVSMAVAEAAAKLRGVPLCHSLGDGDLLPLPEIQIIGGGAHAHWRTDLQDVMLIATGATSYEHALEMTHDVYHVAGEIMRRRGKLGGIADEGGWWPDVASNSEMIEIVLQAIEQAGYNAPRDVMLSLDIAASDLYDEQEQVYRFRSENRSFTKEQFAEQMISWCNDYPIISIEDPAADTDWDGWEQVFRAVGRRVQMIGDDLFTTNVARIQDGVRRGVANSVLIKLNQIGTVSETIEAIRITQNAGWLPVVSARSGETEDAFISHLAVATNAGQLKVGSFARSERMAKWNAVLRIGRDLGAAARFIGGQIYDRILERGK